ncbi:MAG: FliI/YscN family ATPase [Geminicoccaceae bacterium]|nr:FliI/YscN family ATPase [Geminicoccaceae bacterium]MCB2012822.1 FliI/YscN family ATPase [Geminicoccaceae bacterium]
MTGQREGALEVWSESRIAAFEGALASIETSQVGGTTHACLGNRITVRGLNGFVGLGDTCWVHPSPSARNGSETAGRHRDAILAEVVGFSDEGVNLLTYDPPEAVSYGSPVRIDRRFNAVRPDLSWRGRVLDALGEAADGGPPLARGAVAYPVNAPAPPAHDRQLMGGRMRLGVRAMDLFTPCCRGQRLGIFAGSGVGKSSLMSMMAKGSDADVMVIGLIGERGRELQEMLNHTLGPEGLERSVVVAATSDMSAMMRRRAAHVTLAVAEYFRDCGLEVLCLLDSVTRYAMALREIHLAAGEPPTAKGYPPSVFAELPRLLERAGTGTGNGAGNITGLFTVLVEGDDTNEPVSDTVRGILDGHVIMDRRIAEAGRFPAIDVLRSVSRSAPGCYSAEERTLVLRARSLMQAYSEMSELIELGAYRQGSNPRVDEAIRVRPQIEAILAQDLGEGDAGGDPFEDLARALAGMPGGGRNVPGGAG